MVTNDEILFTNDPPFIDHLEWEGLNQPYQIGKYEPLKTRLFPGFNNNIKVFRDDEYRIIGVLSGDFENPLELEPLQYETLSSYMPRPQRNINFSDIAGEYEIRFSYKKFNYSYGREGKGSFESDMNISYLRRKFSESVKLGWLTEWFLNGEKLDIGGTISYNLCKKYNRRIDKPDYPVLGHSHKLNYLDDDLSQSYYQQQSYSKGYIFVEFKDESGEDKCFTIQDVPDNYGPSWSQNVSIEYKNEWWMPSLEERIKINEIVSFLIGRQLISIGYTKYDKKGRTIEDYVNNPQISEGIHIRELCKKKFKMSPVNTIEGNRWANHLSVYFKQLIPNYLALRDELNFNEVLNRYWLSKAIPKEAEIIVLAAGLELLIKSWYKSKKSKTKGVYLPKKEFDNKLKIGLKLIENELDGILSLNPEFKDKIFNTVKNSFVMAPSQRNKNFFTEIGLNIGDIEEEAIIYRNKPVHGDILEDYDKMLKMTLAYLTLVNRTILKILGYENEYVDYFRAIEPIPIKDYVRHIDEPIK